MSTGGKILHSSRQIYRSDWNETQTLSLLRSTSRMMTDVAEVTSARAVVTAFDELAGDAGANDEVIKIKMADGKDVP